MINLKNSLPLILIRCEGSSEIGLGHLMRTLALSRHLIKTQKWNIIFLLKKEAISLFKKLETQIPSFEVPEDEEKEILFLNENFSKKSPAVFLTDSYLLTKNYYHTLRAIFPSTIFLVFDDMAEKSTFPIDGFINVSATANILNYPENKKCFSILGPSFYPLREEFLQARPISGNKNLSNHQIRFCITMGGADPDFQTAKVLKILADVISAKSISAKIQVIVGPAFSHREELQEISKNIAQSELIFSPSNMADIFLNSDLIISAAGSTCHEIAAMRVPMAVLSLTSDQEILGQALEKSEVCFYLGHFNNASDSQLNEKISSFIFDKVSHQKQILNQTKMIDAKGGQRLCEQFEKIMISYLKQKNSFEIK